MKARQPMRLAYAALAGVTLLATGCAGAPTRIHTLDALPSTSVAPAVYSGMTFRVDAVHVPPAFDRPELVRRTEPYALTLSDTDQWAAPIGELIRRTLTEDLTRRLPAGVVIFPDAPKPPNAGGLVVDILSISTSDRGVEMEVSWTWIAPRSAQPAAAAPVSLSVARPLTAHISAPSSGRGAAAVAPELSALLAHLADEIAARP